MKLLLPVIIVLIVLAGGYFTVNQSLKQKITTSSQTSSPTPTSQELKTFQSKSMKFEIQIPPSIEVKDNTASIDLNYLDGQISIVRNGTNFNNLQDYISDFDSKRQLTSSSTKNLIINGYDSMSRIVDFPEEKVRQKSYYIYVDNFVYIFSTTSESLYDELDQIAQSFRYTP